MINQIGSIAFVRQLCVQINGEPYPEDSDGLGYGSVDIVEILSAEVLRLRQAILETLESNRHLADGDNCTLLPLKQALQNSGVPWFEDDEDKR
jgi:hypothetical protein